MSLKSVFLGVVAVAVIAAAYAIYAPDQVEGVSPQAADLARAVRAHLPLPAEKASADAASDPKAPPQEASAPAVPIDAGTAESKDYTVILKGLGQVVAYQTVTVKARVDGQVTKIAFKEGQIVHQGDLLAEIDPRPYQAALDQVQAKKKQDEATLANAKLDLERYSTLAKQSFASVQQLDTQKATVNSDTALVAADQAAIDAAQTQVGYTKIYAPLTGKVGYRLIDQGNMVSASAQTGIVVINQLQPISVTFTAPEENVGEINALMQKAPPKVDVTTTGGAPLSSGVLEVVNNTVDPTTGTVSLKARFANDDQKLWPGLAVIADLTLGIDKNAIVVPTQAVQHGVNGLFVYVVGADNKVQPRTVTVAHEDPQQAAIATGLKAGEKIVIDGQSRLKPGSLVSVQTPARS